ncbi:hypothetical protein MRX96_023375 [Rhipicephalus microplus]
MINFGIAGEGDFGKEEISAPKVASPGGTVSRARAETPRRNFRGCWFTGAISTSVPEGRSARMETGAGHGPHTLNERPQCERSASLAVSFHWRIWLPTSALSGSRTVFFKQV